MDGIVGVIIKIIPLRETGAYYVGRCPWCSQNRLTVSDTNQSFYCFGCKSVGGADDFIKIMDTWEKLTPTMRKQSKMQLKYAEKKSLEGFKQEIKRKD
jgi:DNA primase